MLALVSGGLDSKLRSFRDMVHQFNWDTRASALNYGLNLIPDDILREIFFHAAESLTYKVQLSLVCKRFRTVITSMRRLWENERLSGSQDAETIRTIAEGKEFRSLEAWISIGDGGWGPSAKMILSLSRKIEVLQIQAWDIPGLREAYRALNTFSWPTLHTLRIDPPSKNSLQASGDCCRLHEACMPSLQSLTTIAPQPKLARILTRCCIYNVIPSDDLRDFLSSALSLQHLTLFLRSWVAFRSHEPFELPSLRTLSTNFVPHTSFAERLRQWTAELSCNFINTPEVTNFLSSALLLQRLDIYLRHVSRPFLGATGENNVPSVIELPGLADLRLFIEPNNREWCIPHAKTFMGRLRTPVLQRLTADSCYFGDSDVGDNLLLSSPFVHELELWSATLQTYNVVEDRPSIAWRGSIGIRRRIRLLPRVAVIANAPGLRLIHFCGWERFLGSNYIFDLANALESAGRSDVKIRFRSCEEWRDETFGLDNIGKAFKTRYPCFRNDIPS